MLLAIFYGSRNCLILVDNGGGEVIVLIPAKNGTNTECRPVVMQ